MLYKTRGNSTPHNKPKVLFISHPLDIKETFSEIADDILKIADCVVFYYEDNDDISSEEVEKNLLEMNLIVFPVTQNFFVYQNDVLEGILQFSLKEHIPILPIVMGENLETEYLNHPFLGNIQFLDRFRKDCTQISYEEKLKNYVSSVLISDEMARRVRAAFDAYIFLSYRKKDRAYANQLMHLIHDNPLCRDVAIWYDEYLVPGENYNIAIEHSLTSIDCFALLVTPNLVNENNYVQSIEYPAACKLNKAILPIEMVQTDRSLLENLYKDIPECTNGEEQSQLNTAISSIFKNHALRKHKEDPEHNFLIGLHILMELMLK